MSKSRAASRTVVITGMAGPGYPGLSQSPPNLNWFLHFALTAWKEGDSPLSQGTLNVWKKGPQKTLEKPWNSIRSGNVIRITTTPPSKRRDGYLSCQLIKFHGHVADADLEVLAADFLRELTLEDERLGTFVLDRDCGMYSGTIDWCGTPVELLLLTEKEATARKCLQTIHGMLKAKRNWKKRIEDFAVADLLPLKNENWREDDEPKVTAREFRQRMTLRTIAIFPKDRFEFSHEDGGLFDGHSILVAGTLKNGPTEADIPG